MPTNNKINDLLQEFLGSLEKSAAEETGSEKAVSEGARASENSSDVKSSVPGTSVDAASPVTGSHPGAGTNSPIVNRGTNVGETGTNVPSTKSTYTDPGTSHPAKTASLNELIESANEALAAITVLTKSASVKTASAVVPAAPGNPVVTSTATATGTKPAKAIGAVKPHETKVASAEEGTENVSVPKAEYDELTKAAAFIEELSGYLTGQQVANEVIRTEPATDFQKLAQDEAQNFVALADSHSDNLVHTLLGAIKQANDLAAAGAIDPSAMAEAGPEAASPEMGGMEAMMGGAGGGSPEMGGPAAGAGGGADPATIASIVEALHQAGISIEDLMAAEGAVDGMGGGAEAAPGPEAGGGAPVENAKDDKVDAARAASVGAEDGSNEEKTSAAKRAFQVKASEFAVKFVKAATAKNVKNGKK